MTEEERRRSTDPSPTEELLLDAVRRRTDESEDIQPRFTRRDAYLAIWGVVYCAVGSVFTLAAETGSISWGMGWGFIASGGVSVGAAIGQNKSLDTLAFSLLSGAAVARGLWSVFSPEYNTLIAALGTLLWLGVAGAQVIVAGWPIPATTGSHRSPERR